MPAAVRSSSEGAPPREPAEPPALFVTGVRRTFGSLTALDGVELSLGTGEWTALLGPNGAGKTTLMRIIAGLIREDAGVVSAFGCGFVGRLRRKVFSTLPSQ